MLSDLKSGTFQTKDLVTAILKDLDELLSSKADRDAGRTGLAERKDWMIRAVTEYIRLTTNSHPDNRPDFSDPPDDTVKESER